MLIQRVQEREPLHPGRAGLLLKRLDERARGSGSADCGA